MQVYTYSEARQNLAKVLEEAEGNVLIRQNDGRTFAVVPEQIPSSPIIPTVRSVKTCPHDNLQ